MSTSVKKDMKGKGRAGGSQDNEKRAKGIGLFCITLKDIQSFKPDEEQFQKRIAMDEEGDTIMPPSADEEEELFELNAKAMELASEAGDADDEESEDLFLEAETYQVKAKGMGESIKKRKLIFEEVQSAQASAEKAYRYWFDQRKFDKAREWNAVRKAGKRLLVPYEVYEQSEYYDR